MPVLVAEGAPADEVDRAERAVGVSFGADYREFISRYGGAMVGSLPILGLRKAEVMGDDSFSVVAVTESFREDRWDPNREWAVISIDLAGNPIGLTAAGQVWAADHDAGDITLRASSFEEFVLQLLADIE